MKIEIDIKGEDAMFFLLFLELIIFASFHIMYPREPRKEPNNRGCCEDREIIVYLYSMG